MGAGPGRFAAGALLLLAAAGCSTRDDDPVVQVATPRPAAPAPGSSEPPAARALAPVTTTSPAPGSRSAQDDCGTVAAASGLTLQVLPTPNLPCDEANQLVARFQAQLAGRQPAGSDQPASATVDGWLCVSGPPASQGGTTCSRQDQTVFAGVVTE